MVNLGSYGEIVFSLLSGRKSILRDSGLITLKSANGPKRKAQHAETEMIYNGHYNSFRIEAGHPCKEPPASKTVIHRDICNSSEKVSNFIAVVVDLLTLPFLLRLH